MKLYPNQPNSCFKLRYTGYGNMPRPKELFMDYIAMTEDLQMPWHTGPDSEPDAVFHAREAARARFGHQGEGASSPLGQTPKTPKERMAAVLHGARAVGDRMLGESSSTFSPTEATQLGAQLVALASERQLHDRDIAGEKRQWSERAELDGAVARACSGGDYEGIRALLVVRDPEVVNYDSIDMLFMQAGCKWEELKALGAARNRLAGQIPPHGDPIPPPLPAWEFGNTQNLN
jgi:hypothetical protein